LSLTPVRRRTDDGKGASSSQETDSAEGLTGYHRSNLQHYFDLGAFIWINPARRAPVAVPEALVAVSEALVAVPEAAVAAGVL
jgi:hypothetical protein